MSVVEKIIFKQGSDLEKSFRTSEDVSDYDPHFFLKDKITNQRINGDRFVYIDQDEVYIFLPNQIKFPSTNYKYQISISRGKEEILIAEGDFIVKRV